MSLTSAKKRGVIIPFDLLAMLFQTQFRAHLFIFYFYFFTAQVHCCLTISLKILLCRNAFLLVILHGVLVLGGYSSPDAGAGISLCSTSCTSSYLAYSICSKFTWILWYIQVTSEKLEWCWLHIEPCNTSVLVWLQMNVVLLITTLCCDLCLVVQSVFNLSHCPLI